jgi:hypothetical protein
LRDRHTAARDREGLALLDQPQHLGTVVAELSLMEHLHLPKK